MNFLQKLFGGVKTEKVTIETIEEGDNIVATAHDSWFLNEPNEPKKTLDIYPNDKGKVVKVDKSLWYIMVIWDKCPNRELAIHYMPTQAPPNGWNIKRIKK